MSFEQLFLYPELLQALNESGYNTPTPIQSQAIPIILEGKDLRASAQTGTGKTAAFLLPILQLLSNGTRRKRGPRALILAPTRELAQQIATQAEKYSRYLPNIRTVCINGGMPPHIQKRKLSRPYDLLIATPGRLIDCMQRKKVDLAFTEILVLDEADRMLDLGFIEPVHQIAEATSNDRQTLLFSATLKGEVVKLSNELLICPEEISVEAEKKNHEHIVQKFHYADGLHHKNRLLEHILNDKALQHAIVFTSTKRHVGDLVEELTERGFPVAGLHGDMNQRERTRTLLKLRKGQIKILIATDVAARGIDVQSITHVINFDLPHHVEDYIHRIGRTGRAGATGTAFSLVSQKDAQMVKRIEKYTGNSLNFIEIEGLKAKPRQKRNGINARRSRGKWSKV